MPQVRVQAKLIVVNDDGKLLIARRQGTSHTRPNEWDLLGGGVDMGEAPEAAAARELLEEAGIHANVASHDMVFATSKYFEGTDTAVSWLLFMVKVPNGQTVQLSNEHSEYDWVKPSEFEQRTDYDVQRAAIDYVIEAKILNV